MDPRQVLSCGTGVNVIRVTTSRCTFALELWVSARTLSNDADRASGGFSICTQRILGASPPYIQPPTIRLAAQDS
jgi:hypothetical protein